MFGCNWEIKIQLQKSALKRWHFSADFPDPFKDSSEPVEDLGSIPMLRPPPSSRSAAQSVSQNFATNSPPQSPTLPKGHRRNVSDTSAFNKYGLQLICARNYRTEHFYSQSWQIFNIFS